MGGGVDNLCEQRNECVFDGAQPYVTNIVTTIKDKAALWARAGAPGLRMVIPNDVH